MRRPCYGEEEMQMSELSCYLVMSFSTSRAETFLVYIFVILYLDCVALISVRLFVTAVASFWSFFIFIVPEDTFTECILLSSE